MASVIRLSRRRARPARRPGSRRRQCRTSRLRRCAQHRRALARRCRCSASRHLRIERQATAISRSASRRSGKSPARSAVLVARSTPEQSPARACPGGSRCPCFSCAAMSALRCVDAADRRWRASASRAGTGRRTTGSRARRRPAPTACTSQSQAARVVRRYRRATPRALRRGCTARASICAQPSAP